MRRSEWQPSVVSCIIHPEAQRQESFQSGETATGAKRVDANRLAQEHEGVGGVELADEGHELPAPRS